MKTILYYCLTLLLCISVCNVAEAKKKKYPNGDVYEGEWKGGKPDGKGKMTYVNGAIYEGDWKKGQPEGKGKMVYVSGDIYEGEWWKGTLHYKGKMTYTSGNVYEGEWFVGKSHGKGKMTYANGDVYEGEWKGGKPDGKGKMVYTNGNIYEGDWVKGESHGKGKMIYANGNIYEGEWFMGKFFGIGKMIYPNGEIFEGEWKNDRKEGHGKMIYANGDVYEGEWKSGQPEGKGRIIYANGEVYESESKNKEIKILINPNVNNISEFKGVKKDNGTMTGEVKYSYKNDNCSYTGDLMEYKRHGKGTFCFNDYSPNICISGMWKNDSLVSGSGNFVVLGNKVHIVKEENRPFNFNINIIKNNEVVFVKDVNVDNVSAMEQFYNVVYEEVKKAEVDRFDDLEHQAEEKEKEKLKEKEQIRQELIKKYGVKFANAIVKGEIIVGMTKDMVFEVRSSWSSKRKDTSALRVVEWWDYYGFWRDTHVVFVNGKVTKVSETEK